jgi:hypothetical protein
MIGWIALAAMTQAAPAPAPNKVDPPQAIVSGHTVTHKAAGLTIKVPASSIYVGAERFDLYGVADAEIQVFAEADKDKRLTRLYWIQFESYWPSHPNNHYDYTGDRRELHWGNTVWVNGGPGSTTTPPPRPGGDRAHVQAMLEKAGYKAPPEMMNVRMIQLLDDPQGTGHGRRELMFIYAEDLAPTGKTLAELTDAKGNTTPAWNPLDKPLVNRATTAFQEERQ